MNKLMIAVRMMFSVLVALSSFAASGKTTTNDDAEFIDIEKIEDSASPSRELTSACVSQ